MKKLLLLLFINLIFAYDINDLLKIEAKLYPKIIKLEKTTLNNTLKIAIIYNHSSQKLAKKFSLLLKKENIISYPVFYKNPIPKANAYVLTFKNVTPTLFNKLLKRKKLIFNIYVANKIINKNKNWQKIGTITLDTSTISNSCDHRLHFHHPKFRDNLNYKK